MNFDGLFWCPGSHGDIFYFHECYCGCVLYFYFVHQSAPYSINGFLILRGFWTSNNVGFIKSDFAYLILSLVTRLCFRGF